MNPRVHRLVGIEPDNLLGFLALLGLLRCLEEARPEWRPRASWSVDEPPTRPMLHLADGSDAREVATGAGDGLGRLAAAHAFFDRKNLKYTPPEARAALVEARSDGGHRARLWASMVSDQAKRERVETVDGTPLCLIFGQGHQHFLERLASVPNTPVPPGSAGRRRGAKTENDHLFDALFAPWRRDDPSDSFRWDPVEDVRYAYRAGDPSQAKYKQRTQHGANRLAAIGISVLTVFPRRIGREVRLTVRGGGRMGRDFTFTWPIWRSPMSLTGIEALLDHPRLAEQSTRRTLGVAEVRQARRISVGKFMNFTRATRVESRT